MHSTSTCNPAKARLIFPALSGWVLGCGLQLQQVALFPAAIYGGFVLLALVMSTLAVVKSLEIRRPIVLIALAFGLLAYAVTGLRATVFLSDALDPKLEGRDIAVTGVVAAMPQRSDAGLRFRLEVEAAQLQGRAVRLPSNIYLAWYSRIFGDADAGAPGQLQGQPEPLVAGERWQMTVRLKAPHGGSNPFGFDYELWLWEQGLQATGYVRAGAGDDAPRRLAQTGWHPVERARQNVRDQIFGHIAERQYAGLIAALVVGDQNAIDGAG